VAGSAQRIDGTPPAVTVKRARGGTAVTVRIRDAGVGLDTRSVRISFGDGSRAGKHARFRHRYRRAGVYRIVVRAVDKLGNRGSVRRLVSVR
jgi:PKD domain